MADNDVKIKVSLDGDKVVISGLEGIGDSADKADSKLGGMVKGGLKGAGAALVGFATAAVAAGGALTAGVVSAYADYEQNIGGIETMFKDASGTMMQYADDAYRTAGLSANDYMSQVTSFSAALIRGLGGDTKAAAEYANMAMIDMSDNANKFGSNIIDIQNAYQGFAKQNYTMLDNLKLGYGGTADEMARLINDSGVMGDTFVATAQNMNEVSFDKIVEAIHVVQTEMGIAGTTALEAEQTISGSIGMLQSSFQNLLTGLGSADADVATLAGNVIDSLELVITNIAPVIENIGSNIATLGPKLGDMMGSLVGVVVSAIPTILDAGVALIGGLVQGISSALPSLIEAAVPAVVGLVQMIATQLPLLVDAGMKAVISLGQGLVQALPTLVPVIVSMMTGVVDGIVQNLPMLLDVALQLVLALAEGLLTALPTLISYLPTLIQAIVDFIIGAIPMIIQAGVDLLLSLVAALPRIITGIVAAIPQIIAGLLVAIVSAYPQLIQAGIDLLLSLVEAMPEIIVGIVEAIPQIITALLDALTNSIPLLIQAGIDLLMGLIGALPQIINGLLGAIPQIISALVGAIEGSVDQLVSAGYQLFMSLIGNIGPVIGNVVNAVNGLISNVVNTVIGGVSRMVSAGGDLVRGIWDGISGAAGWLWNQVSGWLNDLWGGILGFFGIHSPSRRMRDEVGKMLPAGMGEGITEAAPEAIKPIQNLSHKLMQEASEIPDLTISRTFQTTQTATLDTRLAMPTPRIAVDQSTSWDAAFQSMVRELRAEPLQAQISNKDMDMLASKVQAGIVSVRSADGRDAQLAVIREVR